jgi:hypothetical protein
LLCFIGGLVLPKLASHRVERPSKQPDDEWWVDDPDE